MKAKFYLLFLFSFLAVVAFSQTKRVTGHVYAENGKAPLSGVTVTIKGTKKAVITNSEGKYSIDVPETGDVVLVFSSVGQTTKEITLNGRESIDVSLLENATTMNDVVVIGYQTVKRKDLLASVSSVSARDLKDIPLNSAAEALNGRLAGVTATTSEGSPDAQVTIRVRGGMSISGDNTPLYVVDGVQIDNALSTISPQDIQSIDVLKDAAATAIYGSRGANGVIIITTKSGKPGRTIVGYSAFYGVKTLAKKLPVLTPYDYVFYQSERSRGSSSDSSTFATNFGHGWDTLANYKNVSPVDWQDQIMGNDGNTQTHNVTVSGGNKAITYNFGYTYNNDKAIVINSNYKRHLLNAKAEYRITDNLKLGVGGRYTLQNVYGAGVSSDKGSAYNRLRNTIKYRPFLSGNQTITEPDPLADPNVGNGLNLINPVQLANAEYRRKTTEASNFTANLGYTITKNLSFRSTFGYDYNSQIDRQFNDSITPLATIQGAKKPMAGLDTLNRTTINNSNVFTYSVKNYRQKHNFDILLGEETVDIKTSSYSRLYGNYPLNTNFDNAFHQTDSATPFAGYPKMGKSRATWLSFFTRISYSYKDKYLFSGNLRADASSKFGDGKKWGYFPSASFAWRASKEKFMENIHVVSDLKFRLGYGKIGNSRIGDYQFLSSFGTDGRYYYGINGQPAYGVYPVFLENKELQWEASQTRNLGMDVSLWKGRLNVSLDVYQNTSDHLLLLVAIPPTYGYSVQQQNIGKTSNRGFEIQLSGTVLQKKNFSWTANFNMSFNKNRVDALGVGQSYQFPAASWGVSGQPADYILQVGQPLGSMYGLVTDGFYKVSDFNYNQSTGVYTLKPGVANDANVIGVVQPGSIKFQDLNGDGLVDLDHDRRIIGNPTPKFTGGLNQQITYKRWDASVFVNFSYGNDIYNANKIEFTNGYTGNANMLADMADRWKVVTSTGQTAQWVNGTTVYGIAPAELEKLNANAKIWQPLKGTGAFYPHSWAIEDGSFLRLNNVSIGYTFPLKVIRSTSKVRVYFTGNNLAIITNYTGYDPEVSVRTSGVTPGLDYSAYPKSRTFIFGFNATF